MTKDLLAETKQDVENLMKEYFGIGDRESDTLMKIAKQCAAQGGVPMAGAGAVALAGTGTVVVPLLGALPGGLAGAIGGFVAGTTACMIARRSATEQAKRILGNYGMSETKFKNDVKTLLNKTGGGQSYVNKT